MTCKPLRHRNFRIIAITTITLWNTIMAFTQQNLVVGYSNPNQDTVLSGITVNFDTILVMNHSKLSIQNSHITVKDMLVVNDSAVLSVAHSNLKVTGSCVFYGESSSDFKDTLTLNANLICGAGANLTIDSAYVVSEMSFMGQYEILGFDKGQIHFKNSTFNLNDGKFGGGFRDQAGFYQNNNLFISSIGIGMTLGFLNSSQLDVSDCFGGMEIIVNDSTSINIEGSDNIILWFGFSKGDTVNTDFPGTNRSSPPSSDILNFSFSNSLPNVQGINYKVNMANCNTVYWALFLAKGCNVTMNNDSLLAIGLIYDDQTCDTLKGLVNNHLYENDVVKLSDRNLTLNNSLVYAWNFYPGDSSQLVIEDCIFGEVLTSADAKAQLINSICDGSGGYVGASGNSQIYAKHSQIKRMYDGPPIILNSGQSFTVLENCSVEGDIILNQKARLVQNNTSHSDQVVLNQESYLLNVKIDSIQDVPIDTTLDIKGSLSDLKGISGTDSITGFRLFYTTSDSLYPKTIIDTTCQPQITGDLIYTWNTSGLENGEYIIWLTVYVNEDSIATTTSNVILKNRTHITNRPWDSPLVTICPNPAISYIYIQKSVDFQDFEVQIQDLYGNTLIEDRNKERVNISSLKPGMYVVRLIEGKNIISRILLIK